MSPDAATPAELDPITLTVIQAGLGQVCAEMDLSFSRAAFSQIIAEANDRADGIYSAEDGSLIAQGIDGRERRATLREAETGRRRVRFGEDWHETPVYWRDRLPAGAELEGPAIVEQMDATTVIEPGDRAAQDGDGNLLVTLGTVVERREPAVMGAVS